MKTALMIIDVQQALCAGPWAAFEIEAVIGRINALSTRARAVGWPVVLVQHEEAEAPMLYGTEGWALAEHLLQAPSDMRLRKTTPSAFEGTELQSLLQAGGVSQLWVCGLQTDFCVNATVRAALALGYPVQLAADAHSTLPNHGLTAPQIIAQHNVALAELAAEGAQIKVLPAAELLAQMP